MSVPDDLDRGGLLAEARGGDNAPPLSVGELSGALKRTVETAFSHVRVRGEISGWKRHASGHCYFTLKDEAACIDAVIWRGQAAGLAFRPEDGAEVVVSGKLTTYPGRSKYQVVVSQMELAGEGALMALLDRRRRALVAEGLFDAARKRPLPFLPRTIGVVTSPTGAVIRDILHRLADRCPTHVMVWPVPVQGEGAAPRIAAAIRGFAAMTPRPDLIIVARGGGSIEDLWAFNEEEVVRAAASSPIPLISAVGHETDTTLIDHAADRRAPTPTAAAEMAVPVRAELQLALSDMGHRQAASVHRMLGRGAERLEAARERWPESDALVSPQAQRLDELAERLPRSLAQRAAHARADLGGVAGRLDRRLLDALLVRRGDRLGEFSARLPQALGQRAAHARADYSGIAARLHPRLLDGQLARRTERLAQAGERLQPWLVGRKLAEAGDKLAALERMLRLANPDGPLDRGYVRVTDRSGRTLVHAAQAREAHAIELHFADGMVPATTGDGVGPVGFRPARRAQRLEPKGKNPYPPKQPGLFGEEE